MRSVDTSPPTVRVSDQLEHQISNGLDTPITKEMLLECVEKVNALEAELGPLSFFRVIGPSE